MLRFCNCDGISASRKVSKSSFVNAGGGVGCGAEEGPFAGGGDGSDITGDGMGPCAFADDSAPRIVAAAAVDRETNRTISFCTNAEFASCEAADKGLIYFVLSLVRRDRIVSIRLCNFLKC